MHDWPWCAHRICSTLLFARADGFSMDSGCHYCNPDVLFSDWSINAGACVQDPTPMPTPPPTPSPTPPPTPVPTPVPTPGGDACNTRGSCQDCITPPSAQRRECRFCYLPTSTGPTDGFCGEAAAGCHDVNAIAATYNSGVCPTPAPTPVPSNDFTRIDVDRYSLTFIYLFRLYRLAPVPTPVPTPLPPGEVNSGCCSLRRPQ
jgi:hypothetical protein